MAFTPEFGTNTGQQGIYNPRDPRQQQMAIARLIELQKQYGERLNPNYTGNTGLNPNDSAGWYRMQNAVREADNISRLMGGSEPRRLSTQIHKPQITPKSVADVDEGQWAKAQQQDQRQNTTAATRALLGLPRRSLVEDRSGRYQR
jgi:hypothetical protein